MSLDRVETEINPSPDGRPWAKSCKECVFRRSNPQQFSDAEFEQLFFDLDMGLLEFYCVHQETEGGLHRMCAAYRALYRPNLPPVTAEKTP